MRYALQPCLLAIKSNFTYCMTAGPAGPSSDRSASPAASRPFLTSPQPSSIPQSSVNGHAAPHSPAAHVESAATAQVDVESAATAHVGPDSAVSAHVDVLAELPSEVPFKGGVESPSISDGEQYQKLDGDLWQQGQGTGQSEDVSRPAGTLIAPDVEPEVHQADIDDRKVRSWKC